MEVAGRQQQRRRVPAFGEWNYGVDGDTPLTPCFDVVAARMTNTHAARKPNERPGGARGNARRRRVPAFGEWNHRSDGCSWPAAATPFSDLAAAQKPPETQRRRCCDGGVAEAYGRSKVADSGAYAANKSCFTVVLPKAVDDDLYGVPPDIVHQNPARRRGWLRFLLMAGCFCPGGANTA